MALTGLRTRSTIVWAQFQLPRSRVVMQTLADHRSGVVAVVRVVAVVAVVCVAIVVGVVTVVWRSWCILV